MLLEILFPCLPSHFAANLVPGSSRQHAESRVSVAPPELSGPWGAHTAVPKVGITAQEQRLPGAKGFQCRFASPWGSSPPSPAPCSTSQERGERRRAESRRSCLIPTARGRKTKPHC